MGVIVICFQHGDVCSVKFHKRKHAGETEEDRSSTLDWEDINFSPLFLNPGKSFKFFKFQPSHLSNEDDKADYKFWVRI